MAFGEANKYLSNHYEGMEPEQLILLLFKGALSRIELSRQGILERDIQKRGENLSKVIAIVSELNAAVDPEMNDESTRFLRGLYGAILTELPKVSITNDIQILDRTEKYLTRLKNIWETNVMGRSGSAVKTKPLPAKTQNCTPVSGYGSTGYPQRFSAFSV